MGKLKVVVIGTGVGGAGAATLMQHRGCDVTVLDKNPYIGGRCHSYEKDGYIVDSGIHMFSRGRSGPLAEINSIVGGDLRWLTPRTQITFVIGGKYKMPYCQPIYDPEMALKLVYIAGMTTLKSIGSRSTASGRKNFMDNTLFRLMKRDGGITGLIKEMINLVSINEIYLSELDDVTVRDFLLGFTDNITLHQVVAYAAMILTSTPYTVCSAGEVLWSMMKQVYAASFGVPEGASRAIPVAYIEAMLRDGGTLRLSTAADKILTNNGEVTGVKTREGEEIPADVVISNAGILLTCEMAGEKALPADYYKRAHELKTSYSHITRKYALSRKVADIGSNGVFNVPDMDPETMFDYTDNGGVPDDAYMFTSIPTEVDHNLAEPGKQLIIMGMPGPRSGDKSTADHCNRILEKGEDKLFSYFPRVKDHIEWKVQTNSSYYSQMTGKPTGDSIGIGQIVGQTGEHKPQIKTPIKNLYLVGGDVGGRGIGTELAAAGALRVADLIMADPEHYTNKGQ